MDIFKNERILWQGTDDTTPEGCSLVLAEVLGIARTYLLRDGAVIGRVEIHGTGQTAHVSAWAGPNLIGGVSVGFVLASSEEGFARILARVGQKQEA